MEARRRIFRCLWMWSIARFETKAFWSFARGWKSVSWFCAVKKVNFEKSLLANSIPRSVYKKQRLQAASVQSFCKGFENRLACFVLQRLSSCKENFSTTINMNVWPSLKIFAFGKSIKSACHRSSTPLTTVRRRWKLRRTSRCKECRDAQSVYGECV